MGRYSRNGSVNHALQRLCFDCWRLTWVCDRYYVGDRCRYPRRNSRETDAKGALRFCKRWDISIPEQLLSDIQKVKDEI